MPYANGCGRVFAKLVAVLVTNIRNEFRESFNGTSKLRSAKTEKEKPHPKLMMLP